MLINNNAYNSFINKNQVIYLIMFNVSLFVYKRLFDELVCEAKLTTTKS